MNSLLEIELAVKQYHRGWSDQTIHTILSDSSEIDVCINDKKCNISILAESIDNAKDTFYLVWELLAWYDGYFFQPVEYKENGKKRGNKTLFRTKMYKTDRKWINSATLLAQNKRVLSDKLIKKYKDLRNKDRDAYSMNAAMINSYFYLMSSAYAYVNIEHRLVLLMHICDGLAREYLNGSPKNNSGNINIIMRRIDKTLFLGGASLLDVDKNKALDAIGNTRNELTHFRYDKKKRSIGYYISSPNHFTDQMINLYIFYVLQSALRISMLEVIGFDVESEVRKYLMDDLLDWIKIVRNLEDDCVLPRNMIIQILQRMKNNTGQHKKQG